jgi:hypothetical protein
VTLRKRVTVGAATAYGKRKRGRQRIPLPSGGRKICGLFAVGDARGRSLVRLRPRTAGMTCHVGGPVRRTVSDDCGPRESPTPDSAVWFRACVSLSR